MGLLLAQVNRKDEAREVLGRSAQAYRQLGNEDKTQEVEELIKQL
jgi:hypothetical protein